MGPFGPSPIVRPSTCTIGTIFFVVLVKNASSALNKSASYSTASSQRMPAARPTSMVKARVMPASRPASSGDIDSG